MEHRWGKRLSARLDVLLKRQDKPVLHGQLRNISPEGMFIRVESDVLPERVAVEIELPLNDASSTGACRVKAWVAHCSEAGVGLFFYSVDRDDYRRLLHFIQQRSTTGENKEAQYHARDTRQA